MGPRKVARCGFLEEGTEVLEGTDVGEQWPHFWGYSCHQRPQSPLVELKLTWGWGRKEERT